MTIQRPTTPTDGETKPTWTTVATNVPASRVYRPRAAGEIFSGDRIVGLASEEVTYMFRGDVTPKDRLRFPTSSGTDDVLEILSVGNPDGHKHVEVARCNRLEST